jgi:putative ABC transport system permease protein
VAAFNVVKFDLSGAGEPESVFALAASANLFGLLGVKPVDGRTFTDEEDTPGNSKVVMLSDRWLERHPGFGSTPVGKSIFLNGESYTVVGILPKDFQFFLKQVDVWVPIAFKPEEVNARGNHYLRVIARLVRGVPLQQAQAELDTKASRLEQQFPDTNTGHGVRLVSLSEQFVKNIRPSLLILLGAVALVLLIACANVSNLLLARAAVREREVAVRVALGAGRRRLVRQFLTESVVIAIFGGTIAIFLAYSSVQLITSLIPTEPNSLPVPGIDEVTIDIRVLVFTMLVSLLTGLVFGLVPALRASRPDLGELIKESGKGTGFGSARRRVHSVLAVFEIAIALVLLIAAALVISSFLRLRKVDPGFKAENVITASVSASAARYPRVPQQAAFFRQVLERISALPGVESAGAVVFLPLSGSGASRIFTIEGRPMSPGEEANAGLNVVAAEYFPAMQIPLVKGRLFDDSDAFETRPVAIINTAMAHRYWSDEPIGMRLKMGPADSSNPWVEIVGVVADVRHSGLDKEARPEMYLSYLQVARPFMTFVARSSTDPMALARPIRQEIWQVDKDISVTVRPLEELVSDSIWQPRFQAALLTSFGVIALALAAIGLYGLVSYSVSQRTHEIGIRMALGAKQGDILRLVLRQSAALALIGVTVGLVLTATLVITLGSTLKYDSANYAPTFIGTALFLMGVVMMATYIPARRASKVSPLDALRYQ